MFRFHVPAVAPVGTACGLIAAAVVVTYAGTLHAPFVFDGLPLADRLRGLTWNPAGWFTTSPRTFGSFTFDLQYTLHGRWLPGFHAVNIAIHATAALALFGAVLVTCRGPRMPVDVRRDATGIAFAAAVLFAVHPLQTQSVTYLYQRYESLMGMFFLLAVLCFALAVRAGPHAARTPAGWFLCSWLAVLLSIASKEVGAAAPLVLLWYDRAFAADSWQDLWARRRWFHLPFGIVFGAGLAYLIVQRDHYAAGGIFVPDRMPMLTYARTQPEVICRYLGLVLWPRGQCLDWRWPPADTAARIVPPLVLISAILGLTGWAAVRWPAIGFLLGAFFLILAPTSSLAPIIDLAFEHRMYLPLAPLAVLVVLAVRAAASRLTALAGRPDAAAAAWLGAVLAAAAALGVTTVLRNEVYRSGITLWADVVAKVPGNGRAYSSLAWHVERETGDVAAAIRLNRHALRLDPSIATAHRGLAILLAASDRPQAIHHARQAVRIERTADNLNNLGIVIAETDPAEAEACFREAVRLDGRLEAARLNLAQLLAMRRRDAGLPATPHPDAERAAPPAPTAP